MPNLKSTGRRNESDIRAVFGFSEKSNIAVRL
jgi:hypothetical protein